MPLSELVEFNVLSVTRADQNSLNNILCQICAKFFFAIFSIGRPPYDFQGIIAVSINLTCKSSQFP